MISCVVKTMDMSWTCQWKGKKRYYEALDGKVILSREEEIQKVKQKLENFLSTSNSPLSTVFVSKDCVNDINEENVDNVEIADAYNLRLQCRKNEFQEPTCNSSLVGNHVQANVVILPSKYATDFLQFCLKNYQGCPLLEMIGPGQKSRLCKDLDIRSDLPKYWLYQNGSKTAEFLNVTSIFDENDFVTFLLGCSFSWENLLSDLGLCPRQVEEGFNVPMYRCLNNHNTPVHIQNSAQDFAGHLVVSMRPYKKENIQKVIDVTKRFPQVHGAPVHIGNPEVLGIKDLDKPDFGDKVTVREGEVPVFWACGITSQEGLMSANLPFAITHAPGHMLVMDISNSDLEQ